MCYQALAGPNYGVRCRQTSHSVKVTLKFRAFRIAATMFRHTTDNGQVRDTHEQVHLHTDRTYWPDRARTVSGPWLDGEWTVSVSIPVIIDIYALKM